MNAFIPDEPKAVVLVAENGIVKGATNVSPNLKVVLTPELAVYDELIKGLPFPLVERKD
jgi:hypothetical protein